MNVRLTATAVAGLFAGALAAVVAVPGGLERGIGARPPIATGTALVGGPFSLVDHTGKAVTDADFRGRHMLVMFGFTACPDDCPAALQVMAAALDRIGAKAERVVPLFITLDPERDGPERLARYLPNFHPRLVGLTGSRAAIEAVAKAYRVYSRRVDDAGSAAGYTLDHSSYVYLMDARGRYVTHFPHITPSEEIAASLRKVL